MQEPSADEDPKTTVEPALTLVATYRDVFGNEWESKQELQRDAGSGDLKLGHMYPVKLKGLAKEKAASD